MSARVIIILEGAPLHRRSTGTCQLGRQNPQLKIQGINASTYHVPRFTAPLYVYYIIYIILYMSICIYIYTYIVCTASALIVMESSLCWCNTATWVCLFLRYSFPLPFWGSPQFWTHSWMMSNKKPPSLPRVGHFPRWILGGYPPLSKPISFTQQSRMKSVHLWAAILFPKIIVVHPYYCWLKLDVTYMCKCSEMVTCSKTPSLPLNPTGFPLRPPA